MKSEINFKLYYEDIKPHHNNYKGPGAVSIAFEEAIYVAGRQIRYFMIMLYWLARTTLKKALFSSSILLFMMYNRL